MIPGRYFYKLSNDTHIVLIGSVESDKISGISSAEKILCHNQG